VEGEPKRPQAHESKSFRPELTLRGALRKTACEVGRNRWSAAVRPLGFGRKALEWKAVGKPTDRSPCRSKALKGEAQERWELKEAPKDSRGLNAAERVAKP
jgi:hypothetical protein